MSASLLVTYCVHNILMSFMPIFQTVLVIFSLTFNNGSISLRCQHDLSDNCIVLLLGQIDISLFDMFCIFYIL